MTTPNPTRSSKYTPVISSDDSDAPKNSWTDGISKLSRAEGAYKRRSENSNPASLSQYASVTSSELSDHAPEDPWADGAYNTAAENRDQSNSRFERIRASASLNHRPRPEINTFGSNSFSASGSDIALRPMWKGNGKGRSKSKSTVNNLSETIFQADNYTDKGTTYDWGYKPGPSSTSKLDFRRHLRPAAEDEHKELIERCRRLQASRTLSGTDASTSVSRKFNSGYSGKPASDFHIKRVKDHLYRKTSDKDISLQSLNEQAQQSLETIQRDFGDIHHHASPYKRKVDTNSQIVEHRFNTKPMDSPKPKIEIKPEKPYSDSSGLDSTRSKTTFQTTVHLDSLNPLNLPSEYDAEKRNAKYRADIVSYREAVDLGVFHFLLAFSFLVIIIFLMNKGETGTPNFWCGAHFTTNVVNAVVLLFWWEVYMIFSRYFFGDVEVPFYDAKSYDVDDIPDWRLREVLNGIRTYRLKSLVSPVVIFIVLVCFGNFLGLGCSSYAETCFGAINGTLITVAMNGTVEGFVNATCQAHTVARFW